jgi:hypothetical protein
MKPAALFCVWENGDEATRLIRANRHVDLACWLGAGWQVSDKKWLVSLCSSCLSQGVRWGCYVRLRYSGPEAPVETKLKRVSGKRKKQHATARDVQQP